MAAPLAHGLPWVFFDYITNWYYDKNLLLEFMARRWHIPPQPCSSRGVDLEAILEAERGVACCGFATRNRASAGPGPRPPGTRTWPRGARSTDPEEMPETRSAAPGQKSPRWSAERRAFSRWRTHQACRVMARRGCRCTRAPSRRSATPRGWDEGRLHTPGAKGVAGTRRCE